MAPINPNANPLPTSANVNLYPMPVPGVPVHGVTIADSVPFAIPGVNTPVEGGGSPADPEPSSSSPSTSGGPQPEGTPSGSSSPATPNTGDASTATSSTSSDGAVGGCGSHPTANGGGGVTRPSVSGGGPISWIGYRNPNAPIVFNAGAGATLTFPPISRYARSSGAPTVQWGRGWKAITDAHGNTKMQHANGATAVVGTRMRSVVSPASKVRLVVTPFGTAKRFPDGTVIVLGVGNNRRPFRIDAEGKIFPLEYGRHSFGGVSVNVIDVTVVRVTMPDGRRVRYDSRGHVRMAALGTQAGGGAGTIGITGGGPGSQVAGDIAKLTQEASGLIGSALERIKALGGAGNSSQLGTLESMLGGLKDSLAGVLGPSGTSGGGGNGTGSGSSTSVDGGGPLPFRLRQANARPPRAGESIADYMRATLGITVSSELADPGGTPDVRPSRRRRRRSAATAAAAGGASHPARGAQPPRPTRQESTTHTTTSNTHGSSGHSMDGMLM